MTNKQWIEKFIANKNLYCDFIKAYQLTNHAFKVSNEQIEKAIISYDYEYLYGALYETWFEISKSTEIHGPAFDMLCSILDNPVEEIS